MIKIEKLYPRDLIGIIVVIFGMVLMALKINSLVAGLVIMVVTWYFARRMDGEGDPKRDLHVKVKEIEEKVNGIPKTPPVPSYPRTPPLQPGQSITKPPVYS